MWEVQGSLGAGVGRPEQKGAPSLVADEKICLDLNPKNFLKMARHGTLKYLVVQLRQGNYWYFQKVALESFGQSSLPSAGIP